MYLRQLSIDDGIEIFNMLQRIGRNENEFNNTAHGLSYADFRVWLVQQNDWSHGNNLPKKYVPQTIFWLYKDVVPVGIGKIRHYLNDNSRAMGGNIGYAIDPIYRGLGYGTELLKELLKKAIEMNIPELLLSVEKNNPSSKRVIEKNGGVLVRENEQRWFFEF